MSVTPYSLDSLLAPITVEEFFAGYWEKAPLVVARRETAISRRVAQAHLSGLDRVAAPQVCGYTPPRSE